MLHVHSI